MCSLATDSNVKMCGDKSHADDLNVRLGIVSGRVALLLRSTEVKPTLSDLLDLGDGSFLYLTMYFMKRAWEISLEISWAFFIWGPCLVSRDKLKWPSPGGGAKTSEGQDESAVS